VAVETPLDRAELLSTRLGNHVLLKREGLQPVFSFKLRGAYNKMRGLSESLRQRGVIAASAGNHAQGVALSGRLLGIDAVVVMPTTTPEIKVAAVAKLGARAILYGDTFDDANLHARQLAAEQGRTYIHPYDDPEVIAGQGTIAVEILRQCREPIHAIFVPVGGGGLIAGIAVYAKHLYPDLKIIGVEPEDSNCMHAALAAGQRVALDSVAIFADGVAVKQVGEEPFRIAQAFVDEVVLVSPDEICAAIKDTFEDTRAIAEPAGALAIAGLKKYVHREGITGKTLVAIESGANINFHCLRHISERTETGERSEAILAVHIPERPGSFRAFCNELGQRAITEFNYRYGDPTQATVFVGLKLKEGDRERHELVARLRQGGLEVTDLTDNELAKLHIRHMVGGHAARVDHEILYRFEFPERPGALLRFLTQMGARWNISLFHYRNHGAAYGRVLCGMQVPPDEMDAFREFLVRLGYAFFDETHNPAYALFLGAPSS
jgi:threonine dehydratase